MTKTEKSKQEKPRPPKEEFVEIPQGFITKDSFEYVPKSIFTAAQVDEIAEGLKKGMIYVFGKNVSRNTQYNVRKMLIDKHPTVKFVCVVAKKGGQNALLPA